MKREILFRGITDDNQIVYPDDKLFGGLKVWDILQRFENVDQYTGLTDKNGKKIFEGDIIKTELFTKHFKITFGNSEKWGSSFCYQSENSIYFLNKFFTNTSEVIGNIHDNPELLQNGN